MFHHHARCTLKSFETEVVAEIHTGDCLLLWNMMKDLLPSIIRQPLYQL